MRFARKDFDRSFFLRGVHRCDRQADERQTNDERTEKQVIERVGPQEYLSALSSKRFARSALMMSARLRS